MSDYLYSSSHPTDLPSCPTTEKHTSDHVNPDHQWQPQAWSATPEPTSLGDQLYPHEPTELDSSLYSSSNSPRKSQSQLSHSRSYPNLMGNSDPTTTSQHAASLRSGSVDGVEIPQPVGQFMSYSFETNLFNPSHQASPSLSSTSPFHSQTQSAGQTSSNRLRAFSDASLPSSAAGPYPSHFRSRSGSESSTSWPTLHTPITPAEMAYQNGHYSSSFKSNFYPSQSDHHSHHQARPLQHTLSLSITDANHCQRDESNLHHSIYEPPSSAVSENLEQYHNSHAMFGHLNPPSLDSSRRMSHELSDDGNLASTRHTTPLTLDVNPSSAIHQRSHSPSLLGSQSYQQLQAPMSAEASYSRPDSMESNATRARSTSLTLGLPAGEGQMAPHSFNNQVWPAGSQPLSAQIGSQFEGLHLESHHSYPNNMGGSNFDGTTFGLETANEDHVYSNVPHEYQPHMMSAIKHFIPRAERQALLAPYIRNYLSSTNRFLMGERTVLVLSGKVAQKSYGAEKRFLCPPPSALLLGCSWWSAAESDKRRPMGNSRIALVPPITIISMSGEHSMPSEAYSEWMSMSGHVVGDQASLDDVVIAGRCVGKQLHISEVDEKTKKVEALVKVIAPGFGSPESRHIGTFPSRPIKVISKPSKKRQSIKNLDLCIHHGTTIALFNRLRSQTVSTKYLCVSGPAASFPAGDWRAMSGMEEKPFAPMEDQTCFVARTSAWDPFIVLLYNPASSSADPNADRPDGQPATPPGYPRPPNNAFPVIPGSAPMPIYYNQPIVLQCLSTAVVSPVMIIRKVEKGSTAMGGASLDGPVPSMSHDIPVAPGETIGDPVSQLHKIALEVLTDPEAAYAFPEAAGQTGSNWLAALGEHVGLHKGESKRVPVAPASVISPSSSSSSFAKGSSSQEALAEVAYLTTHITQPIPSMNSAASGRARSVGHADIADRNSSEGGKVRRARRVSSQTSPGGGLGRDIGGGRRRAASNSSGYEDFGSDLSDGMSYHQQPQQPHQFHHHPSSQEQHHLHPTKIQSLGQSRAWTIDCGEPAVWTIVGCDIERHTFWVPPVLFNSTPSSVIGSQTSISDVFRTPIPSIPIGINSPTPIPVVHKYLLANPMSVFKNAMEAQELKMITIYGANFSRELQVWFGHFPSQVVDFKCMEVIVALPPKELFVDHEYGSHGSESSSGGGSKKYQIVLVREDGIVFPSKVYYEVA